MGGFRSTKGGTIITGGFIDYLAPGITKAVKERIAPYRVHTVSVRPMSVRPKAINNTYEIDVEVEPGLHFCSSVTGELLMDNPEIALDKILSQLESAIDRTFGPRTPAPTDDPIQSAINQAVKELKGC